MYLLRKTRFSVATACCARFLASHNQRNLFEVDRLAASITARRVPGKKSIFDAMCRHTDSHSRASQYLHALVFRVYVKSASSTQNRVVWLLRVDANRSTPQCWQWLLHR